MNLTTPTLSISDVTTGGNAGPVTFTVTSSAPAAAPIDVAFMTEAGTHVPAGSLPASAATHDYTGIPGGKLTIPGGASSGAIVIQMKAHFSGPPKIFRVRLLSAKGATIAKAEGQCTIHPAAPSSPPISKTPPPIPTAASPSPGSTPRDIADLLNKATAPVVLPLGTYTCNSPVVLTQSAYLNGSTILFPRSFPDESPNVRVVKENLVFDNFIAPHGGVILEAQANNFTASNFKIGVGSPPGSVVQAFKTATGGYNANLITGEIGVCASVPVYLDRLRRRDETNQQIMGDPGAHLKGITFHGSLDEYDLRLEISSAGPDAKIKQSGALVEECIFLTVDNKDTIGGRVGDDVTFRDCQIEGDMRLGQVPGAGQPTTTVGQYCNNIVVDRCAFTSNGSPMSAVETYQGTRVTITNCTFTGYAVPPLTADVLSEVSYQDNVQQTYQGQHMPELWAVSARGKPIDLGGNTSVLIPVTASAV